MKRLIIAAAIAVSAVILSGCQLVKYDTPITYDERISIKPVNAMSTQQALDYIQNALNHPVADRVHGQTDAKAICQNVTNVSYMRHYRTDFYYVEAKSNKQVISSFYVKDKETAEKVAAAIMRVKKDICK